MDPWAYFRKQYLADYAWGGQDMSIMVQYVSDAAKRCYSGPNPVVSSDKIEAFIRARWPSRNHLQSFIRGRATGQVNVGEIVAWMYLCEQFGIHCT